MSPASLQFRRVLSAHDDLVIRGRVEGLIRHGQRLTVGPQGRVAASIHARTVLVEGAVEGGFTAGKSVTVKGIEERTVERQHAGCPRGRRSSIVGPWIRT